VGAARVGAARGRDAAAGPVGGSESAARAERVRSLSSPSHSFDAMRIDIDADACALEVGGDDARRTEPGAGAGATGAPTRNFLSAKSCARTAAVAAAGASGSASSAAAAAEAAWLHTMPEPLRSAVARAAREGGPALPEPSAENVAKMMALVLPQVQMVLLSQLRAAAGLTSSMTNAKPLVGKSY
jgi:hypothetical protein